MFRPIACLMLVFAAASPLSAAEGRPDLGDVVAQVKKFHAATRNERDQGKRQALLGELEKTLSVLSDDERLGVMVGLMDAKEGLEPLLFRIRVYTVSRRVMKAQLSALLSKKDKTVEEWDVVVGHYDPLEAAYSPTILENDGQELCNILAGYLEMCAVKELSVQDQMYLSFICRLCLGTPQVRNKAPLWNAVRTVAKQEGVDGELLLTTQDWVRIQDKDWPKGAVEKELLLLNHWDMNEPYRAWQRLNEIARKGEKERVSEALFACLSDPRQQKRWFTCLAVSNGVETTKALKAIVESDPSEYVRRAAGNALASRAGDPQGAELADFFRRLAADPEQTLTMRACAKRWAEMSAKALDSKDRLPGKKP